MLVAGRNSCQELAFAPAAAWAIESGVVIAGGILMINFMIVAFESLIGLFTSPVQSPAASKNFPIRSHPHHGIAPGAAT